MENKLPPPETALPLSEPERAGAEVLDLCVRRPSPSPSPPPAPHHQPQLPAPKPEQQPSPPAAAWHSPSASPAHAPAHWPTPSPPAPSPPAPPLARPANTYVLQQQLQAPPVMQVAQLPLQQHAAPLHALSAAPHDHPLQPPQPKQQRVRVLSSSSSTPPRYVVRPLCSPDSPYYVPDHLARSPPLPLPAQSSTSPTPACSAAGQRPLQDQLRALAPAASGLGYQEAVPLMLPLASQVLNAGASGGGGGRGGKPTRPFKAYPRDPLSLTAGLQVSDALLPDANERNERFMVFRHHILAQTANGGGVQRRAANGAAVKRPASPVQQPSSSDAQTGEECSRVESPPSKAGAAAGAAAGDGKTQLQQQKDSAYYERRRRNNEAAKRSRDARRAKEDEVAIRAAFLEQENLELRFELSTLRAHALKWQQMYPQLQFVQPQPQQQQQQQQPQQILPPAVDPRAHPQMAVCWSSPNA